MGCENNNCYLLALRNYELALKIMGEKKHFDWVVIILFYSALMFAKTLFEIRCWEIPEAHQSKYNDENIIVKQGMNDAVSEKIGKQIGYDYKLLYRASRRFRYSAEAAMSLDEPATRDYIFFFKRFKTRMIQELNK